MAVMELRDARVRRRRRRRGRRRACGPRSRPTTQRRAGRRSSASRCWARRTRSWPRAASPRRWATSGPRTTGRCTSATPCAAARCSTTGAWPSCTPRRRPTGCCELEDWGALFDRTKDGLIRQRDFGGHRYARLAHVGDRTGLEMIRTLQQRAVAPRHRRLHGVHGHPAAHGRRRRHRRVRLLARDRPVRRLPGAGGRAGHRRHRQGLQGHLELVGVHRRRALAWRCRPAPT